MNEFRIALKNCGKIDPISMEDYLKSGGFSAFQKSLKSSNTEIVETIVKSGLRGRGGAGFPSGLKMRFTAKYDDPSGIKYVVCNADEGEPGTFKDKEIMENDPHLLIEGMLIAAYAIGANFGYIYIRGEYFLSIQRLHNAIENSRKSGFLGKNILGTNYNFDIEIRLGAGSYLCGEELTLLESLEGKRGHPRIKPPFPAEKGLFGKPTLVNNVETLATLPFIIEKGADFYRSIGVSTSPGTKIFNLSGDVNKPGSYELPLGVSLRTLIYEFAGGISNGKKFKAALLGGAAGTFVDESMLDVAMDYDSLANANATLGSGAVIVLHEDRKIKPFLLDILKFFKHESCGKCVPCRVGTTNLVSQFKEIAQSENIEKSLELMMREAKFIKATSLCPLGQSPILPLSSAIKYFKSELVEK